MRKKKPSITVEEFLQFKPKRQDFDWCTNEENLVSIQVPRFQSAIGKSFCKLIGKDDTFPANLDTLGSAVWKHCDGNKTVKQILERIKKEFPNEEDIDQRLFLFLMQMKNLKYIDL